MEQSRMFDAFLDGMAKGALYALAGIVMALILVLLMFAPESKTKTVTEPPCMIRANI